MTYDRLCADPVAVPKADLGSRIRLTAAFCYYQGYLSSVAGEIDGVDHIDDPRLDQLIGQMMVLLFPPIDPSNQNDKPILLMAGQ